MSDREIKDKLRASLISEQEMEPERRYGSNRERENSGLDGRESLEKQLRIFFF